MLINIRIFFIHFFGLVIKLRVPDAKAQYCCVCFPESYHILNCKLCRWMNPGQTEGAVS